MARRRLNTILATTTLAAGLSVAPAWGQSLGDLTETVEDTTETVTEPVTEVVEETTETVTETTEAVTETVEDTTEAVEDTLSGGDDGGTEGADDTDTGGDTGDAPISSDLDVDIAPEDEDGSPQLEVDGGVTVGDQTLDVGSVTDPIEDAIDPDPAPSPDGGDGDDGNTGSTGTSSDSRGGDETTSSTGSRPGGFLAGGGVTAAGGETRSAELPGSGSDNGKQNHSGRTVGESFAAFVANNRGSNSTRGGSSGAAGGSAGTSEIAPPQVAGPADPAFEPFPASQVEEPAVLATPAAAGDPASPTAALLKSLAAMMVLGTGVAFKRTLDEA